MISVIIPTHNRLEELKHALKSVFNQSLLPYEIIVIDDASTCDNQSLIDSFDVPIIYYRFETNQGGNLCRNKGVELSIGEYVAFLDDDDTWHEDKLKTQLKAMIDSNADFCYTGKNIIRVDENLKEISRRFSFTNPKYKSLQKSIMHKNFIGTTSSIVVLRDKFLQGGGFDVEMPALQDYEFYLRFIHKGYSVKGIDEGLVDYFIYQKQSAVSKSLRKNIEATKKIIDRNKYNKYLSLLLLSLIKITIKKILKGY